MSLWSPAAICTVHWWQAQLSPEFLQWVVAGMRKGKSIKGCCLPSNSSDFTAVLVTTLKLKETANLWKIERFSHVNVFHGIGHLNTILRYSPHPCFWVLCFGKSLLWLHKLQQHKAAPSGTNSTGQIFCEGKIRYFNCYLLIQRVYYNFKFGVKSLNEITK